MSIAQSYPSKLWEMQTAKTKMPLRGMTAEQEDVQDSVGMQKGEGIELPEWFWEDTRQEVFFEIGIKGRSYFYQVE